MYLAVLSDLTFTNGFENGNLLAWTSAVTDTGHLTVSTTAALKGSYGLRAYINDNNAMYVQDDTPSAEAEYHARFYFHPNSIPMTATNAHYLFYGYSGASTVVTRVELQCANAACPTSGSYQVRVGLVNNSSTWTNSSWITLTNASHAIEIDFRASATGSLKLYLDDVQKANLTNINNSTRTIDMVQLGPVAGLDTGTRGTEYFDAFESRRRSYIGLMADLGHGKVLAAPAWKGSRSGWNPSPGQEPLFQAGDPVTIDYTYDPLYRLTDALYSDGQGFHYTYDAVGNRLTEAKLVDGDWITTNYSYDNANRLTAVDSQGYTWDDAGNLLDDGAATYVYDSANRLIGVNGQALTTTYRYNGLGDRVSQMVNGVTTNYTLDLNAGLTQVLVASPQPPTSSTQTFYLYGLSRIGELQPGGFVYHLTDALGSVRQLVDAGGEVKLARSYEPYGSVLSSSGSGSSMYAFAGERYDTYINLLDLRSRWYAPAIGRFSTRDVWPGDYNRPSTFNGWSYAAGDPVNRIDPSGLCDNQSYAPELYRVLGCRDSTSGHYAVVFDINRRPWSKYAASSSIRHDFRSEYWVPVRHPRNLWDEVSKKCKPFKNIPEYYLSGGFADWEVNARNLLGENMAMYAVKFDQDDSTWAFADAIGIAYAPYNRVAANHVISHQYDPYIEDLSETQSQAEIRKAEQYDLSRLLLAQGQFAVSLNQANVFQGFASQYRDENEYIGIERYELALIIAYGVRERLFRDTSYGAQSYLAHSDKSSVPSGPNWPYGFTCRDPSPTFFSRDDWKNAGDPRFIRYGLTTRELNRREGWPDADLARRYNNRPVEAWGSGQYPPCSTTAP